MNEVLTAFIIKMNHYNKLVKVKTLTDATFKDFEKEMETKTNEVDKLLEINITNPKELVNLDFTQPLGTELVLYKPDNAENYDKIVTLFEVSGGDANKFIREKFDNAQKPLLFLALDICVFNYSGKYFLTDDLKKLTHEKVTAKKTLPLLTLKAEDGAKTPEPDTSKSDTSESEMATAMATVDKLCKEITNGTFKDIAKDEMWTVWIEKTNAPFYKTQLAYFTELSETLDLKNEMEKYIETSITIDNILGKKDENKYNLNGTGSINELETILNVFTNYNHLIEQYELIANPEYFNDTILLKSAKEEKKDKTFKDNVKQFTEKIPPLLAAVKQLRALQKIYIDKHKNDFFKNALARFEKVIITELTTELESHTAKGDPVYKELIEKELTGAKNKIAEAVAAMSPPIAVGGSIQIGGTFDEEYAKFNILKGEIDTYIAKSDNPKKKVYNGLIDAYTIKNEYIFLINYFTYLKERIQIYKNIVDGTKSDNADANADNKKIIYNYIGTLIDEFICYVNNAEKLRSLITESGSWAIFNPYVENDNIEYLSMVEAVNILIQTITMLLDIYNSIEPNLLNDAIKTRIKDNKWIVLIHKLGNRMYKTTTDKFSSQSEFYKNFMEVQIYRILLLAAKRYYSYIGKNELMGPVPDQLSPVVVIVPPTLIIVDVAEVQIMKLNTYIDNQDKNTKAYFVYVGFINVLNGIFETVLLYYEKNRKAGEELRFPQIFENDFNIIKEFIITIYTDKNKSCEEIFNLFITNFKLKLINILSKNPDSKQNLMNLMFAVIAITFFISNYKITESELDGLKVTLKNNVVQITKILTDPTTIDVPATELSDDTEANKSLKKTIAFCEAIIELKIENQNQLSKAYGMAPVVLVTTSTTSTTSTTATPSSVFLTTAQDKIDIEATFFTLLMFYASYDFSIDGLIVEKFKSKFVEKRFEIKPFLLFDSNEFDIIKKIREKGSDFDPHVFDLTKESLQLFHVGSIGSLWDYANGKLTILLYNMLQISSYKELLKRKYNSNKLFLFECINALKHFKAHILQPGKSSTITFAMSTLKAIEILLVKLSFILNAFESKFIAADSVIFQVTINGMITNYTINSPYEVTSLTISSGSPSLTPRTAADADAVRLEAEAVRLEAEAVAATADAKRLADEARIAAKDVGLETPPLTARGAPEVVGGGTTDLTGHDDTHAYRVATPDYLPLYHKKTENDDHARQMHTTEIKLPIVPTKSNKTQSKERGTKKEPSVRRKKRASSRYTNKIKKILTRVFR